MISSMNYSRFCLLRKPSVDSVLNKMEGCLHVGQAPSEVCLTVSHQSYRSTLTSSHHEDTASEL